MIDEFNFTIRVRCGKRTKPEVVVAHIGTGSETMQIGSRVFTKIDLAQWIEWTVYKAVKKVDGGMNINECVDIIIELQRTDGRYWLSTDGYKQAIGSILQELLDTKGIPQEYMEAKE